MPEALPDFDLSGFTPYRLARLSQTVSQALAIQYRQKFSITIPEWRVLAHLSQHQQISIREIHRATDLDKVAASRAVNGLAKRKLVDKIPNPNDKRLLSLSLSDSGKQMVAEIIPLALGFEAKLLERLDKKDQQALNRIINLLITKD